MIERIFQLSLVDLAQIKTLGEKFYGLTGLSGSFHCDTFGDFWNGYLASGHGSQWVYRDSGIIRGTIGMSLTMSLMDGAVIADEQFWFVDPACRGTAGTRLFFTMMEWAKSSGARRILMGKMLKISEENDAVGKFYERQGFRPLQTQYVLDI